MNDVVELFRNMYVTGDFDLHVLTEAVGGETNDFGKMGRIAYFDDFGDLSGAKSTVITSELALMAPEIRRMYENGQTIPQLASIFHTTGLNIRKILSGEAAKYQPGKIFRRLKDRPNHLDKIKILTGLAEESSEWQRFLAPKKGKQPKGLRGKKK